MTYFSNDFEPVESVTVCEKSHFSAAVDEGSGVPPRRISCDSEAVDETEGEVEVVGDRVEDGDGVVVIDDDDMVGVGEAEAEIDVVEEGDAVPGEGEVEMVGDRPIDDEGSLIIGVDDMVEIGEVEMEIDGETSADLEVLAVGVGVATGVSLVLGETVEVTEGVVDSNMLGD